MTLKEKYKIIRAQRTALLATNFYNLETLQAVIRAAKEVSKPLILQLTKSSIDYMGLKQAVSMARMEAAEHEVETWIHLDHGGSIELVARCLEAGFDSVMIDASEKSFAENVAITKAVVLLAHQYNVCVEAELGYVAKLGQCSDKVGFTKPEEALNFVKETGVDSLAVAIGSAHGFYKDVPKLDMDLLARINEIVSVPLVLHGGSGIPDKVLQDAVLNGICKINLATEIKNAFMKKIKLDICKSDEIDLRIIFPGAVQAVKKLVSEKLSVLS